MSRHKKSHMHIKIMKNLDEIRELEEQRQELNDKITVLQKKRKSINKKIKILGGSSD